jgi:predicted amidophosphoribosyltransferase
MTRKDEDDLIAHMKKSYEGVPDSVWDCHRAEDGLELCPVCGDPLRNGEKFCSECCEWEFYREHEYKIDESDLQDVAEENEKKT